MHRKNIKKVDILHNNDIGLQTGASADKQAYNTHVYKRKAGKSVIIRSIPQSVICKQGHVNSIANGVHSHAKHSENSDTSHSYEHEDGMIVSSYFTENKFSQLQNDDINVNNGTTARVSDGIGQYDDVSSTTCVPVAKVG